MNSFNNSTYRQNLMKDTNEIMKRNCQNLTQVQVVPSNTKSYPYLFNGINDNKLPFGYENSLPKQMYISREKMDSQKRNPLQNDI
jgi:hypothetical protein